MVTYNHQEYIKEALESLLAQTKTPFEIIILDDFSKDRTAKIIKTYIPKFQCPVHLHVNETNLGLAKNIAKIKTLFNGNVISFLPGDDLMTPKTVELIDEEYKKNKINPETCKAIVITNSMILWPSGKTTVWDNYKEKDKGLLKTRLRGSLSYRQVGLSKALFLNVRTEKEILEENNQLGIAADMIKGFEEILSAQWISYLNYPTAIYRYGVGITSRTNRTQTAKYNLEAMDYIRTKYEALFDRKDLLYIDFFNLRENIYLHGLDLKSFLGFIYLSTRNYNNFGFNYPYYLSLGCIAPSFLFNILKSKRANKK